MEENLTSLFLRVVIILVFLAAVAESVFIPRRVHVEPVSSATVRVDWTIPEQPTLEEIRFYVIYYKPSSLPAEETRIVIGSREQRYTVTGLEPFTDYTFCVAVVTDVQEFNRSAPVRTRTREADPLAPRNVIIWTMSSRQLRMTWEEPVRWNGPVGGYVITLKQVVITGEMTSVATVRVPNQAHNSHVFGDLQPDTRYEIYIRSHNGVHYSSPVHSRASTLKTENADIRRIYDPMTYSISGHDEFGADKVAILVLLPTAALFTLGVVFLAYFRNKQQQEAMTEVAC
ncbi:PRTG [Branchiostoma lanceolatum]|uniref:PRTG protein n=1 Tax=Branchiostoma lanceolatum TaxID=7740 RepID=A0A8J9W1M0_BRALA|nr:PRTG [Branchiostoma lanceolatum]